MNESDTATLDGLIKALYETISAGPGEPRDWQRQAALLHPDARMMRSGLRAGAPFLEVRDGTAYREEAERLLAGRGFFEIEVGRMTHRFGNIAQVLSTYEAREHPDDQEVERRGVNSFQCYHDGRRWWLLSALWDNERSGVSVPGAWIVGDSE